MDLRTFLEAVVPPDGLIITATQNKSGWRQQYHTAGDYESAAIASDKHRRTHETYVALSSYKGKKRDGNNVLSHSSIWLDVDAGPDKQYPDHAAAVEALKAFLASTTLPMPSIIVNSGHGLHVYWVFDTPEPYSSGRWAATSKALKAACEQLGLQADHKCTTDVVRVLRPPETFNHKRGTTVPVGALHPKTNELVRHPLDALQRTLKRYGSMVQQLPAMGDLPAVLVGQESSLGDMGTQHAPALATNMMEECPWLARVRQTGGANEDEPRWHQALNLLAECEDGADHIHTISDKHASYSPSATLQKWQKTLAKDPAVRATLCTSVGAPECASCPHQGNIKTPLELGRIPVVDNLPHGYRITHQGLEECKATQNATVWQPIWNWSIKKFELVELHDGDEATDACRVHLHPDQLGPTTFDIPYDLIHAQQNFPLRMSQIGIAVGDFNAFKLVQKFLMKWYSKVIKTRYRTKQAHVVRGKPRWLGWHNDGSFAACGQWMELADGAVVRTPVKLGPDYTNTSANLDEWKRAAQVITDQNWGPHLILLASSFAAPLMHLIPGDVQSGFVDVYSTNSGVGKSTTLKLAQAVWAHPKSSMQLDDTFNAINKRLGILATLPVYWDEALTQDRGRQRRINEFVLMVTQGREKARLKQDAEFRDMGQWTTLLVSCGNHSLREYLHGQSSTTAAATLRVFGVSMGNPPPPSSEDSVTVGEAANKHWGAAGAAYGEYLLKHRDDIKKLLGKVKAAIAVDLQLEAEHRFTANTMAALLVAGIVANRAGLTDFDIPTLRQALYAAHRKDNHHTNKSHADRTALWWLDEYHRTTIGNEVLFDIADVTGATQRTFLPQPHNQHQKGISSERGRDDGVIYIPKRSFRTWLAKQDDAPSARELAVQISDLPFVRDARVQIGKGTNIPHPTAREQVYRIDTLDPNYDAAKQQLDD